MSGGCGFARWPPGYVDAMSHTTTTAPNVHPNDDRPLTSLLTQEPCIAMVTTMIGREHTSRPVACAEIHDHRLSFIASRESAWVEAVAAAAAIVHVTVADAASATYVSLNGTAIVVTDAEEIVRLWTPAARAWFDGPNDPDIVVVHFDVSDGEYWDGPGGRVGRAVAMLRAALSGDAEPLGTQGHITAGHEPIDLEGIVPHHINRA